MIKLISRSWLVQVGLLTLIYFLVGKLALLFAVAPGYASPVWPPAGIGISALLIFGINRWPGCFIGAFLIALGIAENPHATLAAFMVAAGSTGAILLSVCLVRRGFFWCHRFFALSFDTFY